jgi:prolyl-tRNA editing enzyme YbaK/EbsC (Cys-tRNA(Pro) deacylase)
VAYSVFLSPQFPKAFFPQEKRFFIYYSLIICFIGGQAFVIEDFIESNSLNAKILPYAAKGSLVKCRLFKSGSLEILAVFPAKDSISMEKVKRALKLVSLMQVDKFDVEEMTGYKADFLPPISIYGVTVLLDKKLAEKERVRCLVSEERTLEISPKEILEANEEAKEADITV